MLFEDKIRTYNGYARHDESQYSFYDRTCNEKFTFVRDLINTWASLYDLSEVTNLRNRIPFEFNQVFFELFIHTLFLKLGFSLTTHPTVENNNRHPDFLGVLNNEKILIEATVTNEDHSQTSKIKDSIYEKIKKIDNTEILLLIDKLELTDGNQPSLTKIYNYLDNKIKLIDPDSLSPNIDERQKIIYQDKSVIIEITPHPRLPKNRGKESTIIGSYPIVTRWGNSVPSIRKSIIRKCLHYRRFEIPFILALNFLSPWGRYKSDIIDALFGTIGSTIDMKEGSAFHFRYNDGVFYGPKGPQCTKISAILICNVNPYNLDKEEIWLYHNPYARNPIGIDLLNIPQVYIEDNRITEKEGMNLYDILNVNSA
jgi:hypothetical protein